jgi:hypothetical protein
MRTIYLVLLVCLAVGIQPATAKGKQVRYVGLHPVPKAEGGGICYIEGPHVHIFAANKLEYRDHGNHNYFVGDPVAYGYDGPRHAYKGHHPIHVHAVVGDEQEDVEFCYLDGAHFHYFTPPPAIKADFEVAGDAYFYVAEPPPVYVDARPAMIKVNAVYTPITYTRPVIEVEPPSGWIGVRFSAPAVVVVDERPAPVVVVPRPRVGVEVHVPVPTFSVDIGIGGGFSAGGGGRHKHKHKKWKHR